ncbi:hypothetical protein Tco_1555254 [Tanacetum coccineum]
MDYHHLFKEFNVRTARQAFLNAEVRIWTEYCLSERRRLETECEKQVDMLKVRDEEIKNLKAQLSQKEVEAAEAVHFRAQIVVVEATERVRADELTALKQKSAALEGEKDFLNGKVTELQSSVTAKDLKLKDFNATVHSLETACSGLRDQVSGYEQLKEQIEEFQDAQINIVSDKMAKLEVDLIEMALYLEERFYPHLLTTISGRRWLLTHGIKLFVVKCLNSPEYLTTLGTAISRAIEKGMQDGLLAGIDHRKAGRSLADFVAYNPSVEEDYNSALQELHAVDFPLLAERKYEDQVVLSKTSLLFALSVAHSRVKNIRENIAEQRSDLDDVWVPLVEPLSVENLTGAAATFDSMSTAIATKIALSTVVVSTSSARSITIDDYVVIGADGQ